MWTVRQDLGRDVFEPLLFDQDGIPLPFRYDIKGNPKLNFFEPKKLAESDGSSMMELRYSMFGAVYLARDGGLKHVPKTTRASTLWEVL